MDYAWRTFYHEMEQYNLIIKSSKHVLSSWVPIIAN